VGKASRLTASAPSPRREDGLSIAKTKAWISGRFRSIPPKKLTAKIDELGLVNLAQMLGVLSGDGPDQEFSETLPGIKVRIDESTDRRIQKPMQLTPP
jgi:hypothetical protein